MIADVELAGVVTDDDRVDQQPVRGDAAPKGPLGGDPNRIRLDLEDADAKPLQMSLPGHFIGKAACFLVDQCVDHRAGELAQAHVVHRRLVDHVIAVTGAEQVKEVQPALGEGGEEPGEVVVADPGASAVPPLVAGAGVVDGDPPRRFQARPQHARVLRQKPVGSFVEKPVHLALGDGDAEIVELFSEPRGRHLALVMLAQHEPPQSGPEVADEPRRQRRHHRLAGRRPPPFPPKPDHMAAHHQFLDDEVLVALEPPAQRNVRLDDPLFVDRKPCRLATPTPALPFPAPRLALRRLLHAARL